MPTKRTYISKAIEEGRTLKIEYVKSNNSRSVRMISNIAFSDEYGKRYIVGLCSLRNEERTFKISRIKKIDDIPFVFGIGSRFFKKKNLLISLFSIFAIILATFLIYISCADFPSGLDRKVDRALYALNLNNNSYAQAKADSIHNIIGKSYDDYCFLRLLEELKEGDGLHCPLATFRDLLVDVKESRGYFIDYTYRLYNDIPIKREDGDIIDTLVIVPGLSIYGKGNRYHISTHGLHNCLITVGTDEICVPQLVSKYTIVETVERLINELSVINTSSRDIISLIANYYASLGNYNKACDICGQSNKSPFGARCYGELALFQMYCKEDKLSFQNADIALKYDDKDIYALAAKALYYGERKAWKEAEQFAMKAINFGYEGAEPYYVLAMVAHANKNKTKANDYYSKGYCICPYSPMQEETEYTAGCPIEITDIKFGTSNQKSSDYSLVLKQSEIDYIYSVISILPKRLQSPVSISVDIIYQDGKSQKGIFSDEYCFTQELEIKKLGEHERYLYGWGQDTKGKAYLKGKYKYNIYYNKDLIFSDTFDVK